MRADGIGAGLSHVMKPITEACGRRGVTRDSAASFSPDFSVSSRTARSHRLAYFSS